MNVFSRTLLALFLVPALLASCGEADSPAVDNELQQGFWHASISLPGGDIDTGLEISKSDNGYSASLINGQERVVIDEVSFNDGQLVLRFPAFNNEIRAVLKNGQLKGELILVKQAGATQSMPFAATHGAAREYPDAANATDMDLSGRWAVEFHEPDGSNSASIGEFSQRGARLYGTFLNSNGDYRYLGGYVRNREFKLSTFDGAHAFLFTGTLDEERITDADFWSGTSWHQTWSALRSPDVELPDAFGLTYLKPGHDRFSFEFPDLNGDMVSLDDERFDGKVVVVTLAGTWCPNCHDEARFMAPLHKKLKEQGLEVVALMYEHFEDPQQAAQQVALFRDKFDIEYETLIAGTSSKTDAAETLPSLNAVLAFPTTLFIDRSGRVRSIHTGFSGPGTGEHYEALTKEMHRLIEELLAEPADLINSLGDSEPQAS